MFSGFSAHRNGEAITAGHPRRWPTEQPLAPPSGTVTVMDNLPEGVTATAASGTGWECSVSGQTATCTRSDAPAPGASFFVSSGPAFGNRSS